jgi:putative transposase
MSQKPSFLTHMRTIQFCAGEYYHLYNRGVNRQSIFFCDANWSYFLKRLREYCQPEWIDIITYCLMPNHYHLLVYLKINELSAQIMHPFTVAYTKAINRQQKRIGPLFQGPFQAKKIDRNEYLTHLSRYIHLNPVSAGFVEHPAQWAFSSYRDYIGLRNGSLPRPEIILSQFPSRQTYTEFVESYTESQRGVIEHLMLD